MNGSELLRKLKRLGAVVEPSRGKGGHHMVLFKGRISFVPVHGKTELSKHLVHEIFKQLGLSQDSLK